MRCILSFVDTFEIEHWVTFVPATTKDIGEDLCASNFLNNGCTSIRPRHIRIGNFLLRFLAVHRYFKKESANKIRVTHYLDNVLLISIEEDTVPFNMAACWYRKKDTQPQEKVPALSFYAAASRACWALRVLFSEMSDDNSSNCDGKFPGLSQHRHFALQLSFISRGQRFHNDDETISKWQMCSGSKSRDAEP